MRSFSTLVLLSAVTVSQAFIVRKSATISQHRHVRSSVNMIPIDDLAQASISNLLEPISSSIVLLSSDISGPPESGGITYSKYSYYAVLGLYLMSFPGLWSIVKRSTAAKVKRKVYINPGEKSSDTKAKGLRQQAGEIMACKYIRLEFLII
jgi:hypothetical protein